MQQVHFLIHRLSPAEKEVVRNYLTCFSSHKATCDDDSKSVKLFDLLLKTEKRLTVQECSTVIYGRLEYENIIKLKNRLKGKILDALITDVNTERRDWLDEADRAVVIVKKKAAQFQQLLYTVGNNDLTRELLDEIIEISKKYEYYSAVCDALKFKKWIEGLTDGDKKFNFYKRELKKYEECTSAVNKATDYYYELMIMHEFGKPSKEEIAKFLNNSISDVRHTYRKTKSQVVHYYFKYLELEYYQITENYFKARRVCLELLNIVRNNIAVYRGQRIGTVYKNLSRCELFLSKNMNAAESAQYARQHFILKSANYIIAQEQEFYALFYDKQYDNALKISDELLKGVQKELGDFRYAKYCLLHSAVLFSRGDYKYALNMLNHKLELSQDKTGWELGTRVLSIMCDVELKNHREAELKIQSLQKHIDYHGKNKHVSERAKLISKYLRALANKGFMFMSMNGKTDELLAKLCSKEKQYRWEILSPELVPFHLWVLSKLKRKVSLPQKEKTRKRKVLAGYNK